MPQAHTAKSKNNKGVKSATELTMQNAIENVKAQINQIRAEEQNKLDNGICRFCCSAIEYGDYCDRCESFNNPLPEPLPRPEADRTVDGVGFKRYESCSGSIRAIANDLGLDEDPDDIEPLLRQAGATSGWGSECSCGDYTLVWYVPVELWD